jgi:4-hydroxybenzoate polyprenyltransferase
MSTDTKLLLVLLIIALIVVGPFITIWALNTLFPALAIEYTFQTWLAAVILGSVFKTTVNAKQ